VWRVGVFVDAVLVPEVDVVLRDGGPGLGCVWLADSLGKLGHGFESDDALQGEVCLVAIWTKPQVRRVDRVKGR
jgi:hypothetical protein